MFHRYGPCQLSGCDKPKHKRGRYCQQHRKRLANYGHPHGRPVHPSALIEWGIKVRRVLDDHAETHGGIKLAVAELDRALGEAADRDEHGSRSFPHPRSRDALDRNAVSHFARLARHGATALDVLTMIAAVACLDQTEPGRFPDTRSYRFAVARAVLGLVPRTVQGLNSRGGRAIGSNTLAAIAAFLTERYAAIAGVVVRAVLDAEGREATRRAAMTAPL